MALVVGLKLRVQRRARRVVGVPIQVAQLVRIGVHVVQLVKLQARACRLRGVEP